jgi:hypothetical protein
MNTLSRKHCTNRAFPYISEDATNEVHISMMRYAIFPDVHYPFTPEKATPFSIYF